MPEISTLLADLNEKQREAVLATDGPVLVVAGAGSGKTRALTHRIAYLIKEKGIAPHQILAVTFTNKAAGEMRDRVLRLLGKEKDSFDIPLIGTFHSVCVKILRKHIHLLDFENQFAIYDAADQLILVKHIFEDLKIGEKEMNPRAVLGSIGNAKNKLIGPEEFGRMAQSYFEEKVSRVYHIYQERLKKNSALDFDDILMKTVELFRKHTPILDQYQERFRFIHVDEYQDTNHAQYILTNLLAAKYRNICAIGDHDQAIYSWRGATVQNILDFEHDYPEVKVITMEQNYRSTQPILDSAQAVIKRNRKRKDKKLWTDRDGGDTVRLWIAHNERHEAELAAEAIRSAVRGHESADYRDFVILYRTNAQSRVIEEVFMRYGMPYKIIGGIRFYQRKEIKDMLAYLRAIANPADSLSLMRIVNIPQRNIGPKTLEKIETFANTKDYSLFEAMLHIRDIEDDLPEAKKESIEKFAHLIRRLQKENSHATAGALIKFALDETGYKKFLDDGTIEGEARLENVAELISVASKYDKLEPGMSLNVFLEEVALVSDLDTLDEKDNAVTLMTLHSAKGLEFPWVFIVGLEEGLLPHSQSIFNPEELEEERRLFYVGCTRAMDRLHLLYTKNRMLYGETQDVVPSQFLADIPPELVETNFEKAPGARPHTSLRGPQGQSNPISAFEGTPIPLEKPLQEFSDGDRVRHGTFGEGMVVSVAGGVVSVAFKDPKIGIKKLAISIAPLEKI